MYKTEVKVSVCRSGEILASHVVNKDGTILVGKNTILNDFIISILKELGIQSIWVYKEVLKEGLDGSQSNYNEGTYFEGIASDITTIIHNLASGNCSKHETTRQIIKPIYKDIVNRNYLYSYLHELHNFDGNTYTHSINVAFYAMLIGEWLHMPEDKILDIVKAGLLHDIGKLKIEKSILNKKDKLTDLEFMIIKRHCSFGYEMLTDTEVIDANIKQAILYHHERMDGSGYPTGVTGEHISEYTKIIAIADVYDAMTSDRAYKKKVTPFEAFHMFVTEGAGIFEASTVETFLINLSSHLVGTTVLLDNGMTGEVVYISPEEVDKPIVRIMSSYQQITVDSGPQIVDIIGGYNFDINLRNG